MSLKDIFNTAASNKQPRPAHEGTRLDAAYDGVMIEDWMRNALRPPGPPPPRSLKGHVGKTSDTPLVEKKAKPPQAAQKIAPAVSDGIKIGKPLKIKPRNS